MANYRLYHAASKETAAIPALRENIYDSSSYTITFGKILNSHYASYSRCTIEIPTELNPKVYMSNAHDMILTFDGIRPDYRFNLVYRSNKPYFECFGENPETNARTLYRFPVKFLEQ